jgi:glycosyltransferase involved in cell wall biosynthesis
MYAAEFPGIRGRLGLALDRLTLPCADRMVAVSEGVRRELLAGGSRHRVTVVPNAVDLRRTRALCSRADVRRRWGYRDDEQVIGTVGRLTPQKGIAHLVEAARLVCAQQPRARFIHMGAGPLGGEVGRQVVPSLAGRFVLAGHVDDPMALLPGLDLFALPSLWEGLPVALLEAMAAGIPVVGSDVAGINEVIENNRSGLLVPPGDASAMARAITELLEDDETRRAGPCIAGAGPHFDGRILRPPIDRYSQRRSSETTPLAQVDLPGPAHAEL